MKHFKKSYRIYGNWRNDLSKIRIIKKPWGEERLFARNRKYAGKILIVRRGHRLSLQFHKKKDETLYLEDGLLRLVIGKARGKLGAKMVMSGETFTIPRKTIHRIEAIDTCRLIEVSTPELEDVVRIDDDYGRVTKKERRR